MINRLEYSFISKVPEADKTTDHQNDDGLNTERLTERHPDRLTVILSRRSTHKLGAGLTELRRSVGVATAVINEAARGGGRDQKSPIFLLASPDQKIGASSFSQGP